MEQSVCLYNRLEAYSVPAGYMLAWSTLLLFPPLPHCHHDGTTRNHVVGLDCGEVSVAASAGVRTMTRGKLPPLCTPSPPSIRQRLVSYNYTRNVFKLSTFCPSLAIMASTSLHPSLTRSSVEAAHTLIKPHIHDTPVLTNTTLTTIASTPQTAEALQGTQWEDQEPAKPKINLFFKCENFQRIGAFKVRGAFHAVTRLIETEGLDEVRRKGVVTHSSGKPIFFLSSLSLLNYPLPLPQKKKHSPRI
jgi:hypothetical protein